VFTVLLGIALHMEVGNPRKLAGIGLAVAGAVCMVMGGAASAAHGAGVTAEAASNMLLGDFCLLVNTAAMAVYYLLSKQMVSRYPAICVAAWAYLVGEWLAGWVAGWLAGWLGWCRMACMHASSMRAGKPTSRV
jgi:drug/metabolite transporter (DMT)-like permease